jgi:hypothetical protein
MQLRRVLKITLGLVGLVVVVAIVVSGLSSKSKSMPPGPWGRVVSCLEGHPLFAVYDAASSNASAPTSKTTRLDVWQNLKGIDLANMRKLGTAAEAEATARSDAATESHVGDASDNVGAIGPVEYLFVLGGNQDPPQPLADPQNQLDIADCIEQGYRGEVKVVRSTPSPGRVRATATRSGHTPGVPHPASSIACAVPTNPQGPTDDRLVPFGDVIASGISCSAALAAIRAGHLNPRFHTPTFDCAVVKQHTLNGVTMGQMIRCVGRTGVFEWSWST